VIDDGKVVGTVTEESIMRRLGSNIVDERVKEVMVAALPIIDEEAEVERVRGS
jgi:predicted transcriptional regulator